MTKMDSHHLSSPTPAIIMKPLKTRNLDLLTLFSVIYWFETKMLNVEYGMHKLHGWLSVLGNFGIRILWKLMHLALGVWLFSLGIVEYVESFLIAGGFFKKYKALDTSKVQYLAVVIDSEDARQTLKVIELLQWLVNIGVKKVCLYDSEGVLKKYKEVITDVFNSKKENAKTDANLDVEFISFSDGKEAVAKAANFLLVNHYATIQEKKSHFTEPRMEEALEAIGSGGPEPDLLLVYGPTRCHFGFPAWRLRYTEIVHLGPLKSMMFGALVKAIFKFTTVKQNYGT